MQHECKITVLETKVFPDLQEKYLADPKSGPCPFFHAGDTFVLKRTPEQYGTGPGRWILDQRPYFLFSIPQSQRPSSTFTRECPLSVREYSTLGGICG